MEKVKLKWKWQKYSAAERVLRFSFAIHFVACTYMHMREKQHRIEYYKYFSLFRNIYWFICIVCTAISLFHSHFVADQFVWFAKTKYAKRNWTALKAAQQQNSTNRFYLKWSLCKCLSSVSLVFFLSPLFLQQ